VVGLALDPGKASRPLPFLINRIALASQRSYRVTRMISSSSTSRILAITFSWLPSLLFSSVFAQALPAIRCEVPLAGPALDADLPPQPFDQEKRHNTQAAALSGFLGGVKGLEDPSRSAGGMPGGITQEMHTACPSPG